MSPRLESVLGQWRSWAAWASATPELIRELPGGRTNHSYLVGIGDRLAVLRLNADASETLGVDREREVVLHRLAAGAGFAPPLLHSDPQQGFFVTAFIAGRRWQREDMASDHGRRELAALVSRIQSLPVILPSRDYVIYVERYWALLKERGALTAGLRRRRERVLPQIIALQQGHWQPVVVHHDLVPENLIEHQGRLFLLDWEYAACGHPHIDLMQVPGQSVDPRVTVLVKWMNELWEHLQG